MSPVATGAPEGFSLVLASTPPGGVWNNNPSPPGTFELVYGSRSQNKWETFWRSRGHGGHMCTRSKVGSHQRQVVSMLYLHFCAKKTKKLKNTNASLQ